LGVKRSLQVDGAGAPLGVAVAGANRHDMKLVEATLDSMPTGRPDPEQVEQNLCLDKGYDYPEVEELVEEWGYTPHISQRGQKTPLNKKVPGYRARRWMSERTHSWMNRFRRLLIRWEKNPDNYLAMIHLACAYITARVAGILG
jgi:transposase